MNPIMYALLCYGLTAAISLLVIAIVLGVNSVMSKIDENGQEQE